MLDVGAISWFEFGFLGLIEGLYVLPMLGCYNMDI